MSRDFTVFSMAGPSVTLGVGMGKIFSGERLVQWETAAPPPPPHTHTTSLDCWLRDMSSSPCTTANDLPYNLEQAASLISLGLTFPILNMGELD